MTFFKNKIEIYQVIGLRDSVALKLDSIFDFALDNADLARENPYLDEFIFKVLPIQCVFLLVGLLCYCRGNGRDRRNASGF